MSGDGMPCSPSGTSRRSAYVGLGHGVSARCALPRATSARRRTTALSAAWASKESRSPKSAARLRGGSIRPSEVVRRPAGSTREITHDWVDPVISGLER